MEKRSFMKVAAAGFTFYRTRWSDKNNLGTIWCATEPGAWRLYLEKAYLSKAALWRAMDEIINKDPFALLDENNQ